MVVHHAVRDLAPTAGAAPAIDFAAALERVMGERDLLLRVLARFAGDYRDVAPRLHAALVAHDSVQAQRIAHTLKGAAGMIDAVALRQRALELELALRSDAGAPTIALVKALDAELARVLKEVEALLAAPQDMPVAAAPIAAQQLMELRAMLDIGDGRAPDLVRQWHPNLLATLGPERMQTLDTAIGRFDFERALALLEGREESEHPAPGASPPGRLTT